MSESRPSGRTVGLIAAVERDACYYGVARLSLGGVTKFLEFEVDSDSYHALRRVLELRPFPVNTPTHAFTGHVGGTAEGSSCVEIRVDQGRGSRLFEVPVPHAIDGDACLVLSSQRLRRDPTPVREVYPIE